MARLLDFVSGRRNPFVIVEPNDSIKLHNFITKQTATTEVSRCLLQLFTEGTKHYDEFKQEQFIERRKKLSGTISRRYLPQMDYIPPCHGGSAEDECASGAAVAEAQHEIDIARQRGLSDSYIFSHDVLPNSALFEGNLPKKAEKSKPLPKIEKCLTTNNINVPCDDVVVVVDFMLRIRTVRMAPGTTFGSELTVVFSSCTQQCNRVRLHVIFDSYLPSSIKDPEHIRRGQGSGVIQMVKITSKMPLLHQMEKFWPSVANKAKLKRLARYVVIKTPLLIPVVSSICDINDEILPATVVEDTSAVHPVPANTLKLWCNN